MIDLELYRIFKIVADEENLTRASEKLLISQPAVTKHIHNLENEMQVKLFVRTKYGMKLTLDGKNIYNQIKDPINILMNVENSLKQATILNLGIHTNMPRKIYRNIRSKLENEKLNINIEKAPTEIMFSMLEEQKIDAYLSKKQPEDVHSKNINFINLGSFHDDFFVNANSKYLNYNILNKDNGAIEIYTLRTISSTSRNLEKIIKENNLNNIIIKNLTFNTIIEEMQNKDIIAYITEEYIQEELENGKLKKINTNINTIELEYGIYYNVNNKIKNIKRIFEKIKNVCEI